MKKLSTFLLLILISSCSSEMSNAEKLAIAYFKGQALDPDEFELIKAETILVTKRDLEVEKLRLSIKEVKQNIINWQRLEALKRNPENGNLIGVIGYSLVGGDEFASLKERLGEFQVQVKLYPQSSYVARLRDALMDDIEFHQNLHSHDPKFGKKRIGEIEDDIASLSKDDSESSVSHYQVKLRFYAMNRLGIRGISDAVINVYLGDEGELVLGAPEVM